MCRTEAMQKLFEYAENYDTKSLPEDFVDLALDYIAYLSDELAVHDE